MPQRRKVRRQRRERRGQRHVQADRGARAGGVAQRRRFGGEKLGVPTITEVALMRRRAMRSRIAALTAGEMP